MDEWHEITDVDLATAEFPMATEVAVRPVGKLTATGVELSVVVPSPRWPQ